MREHANKDSPVSRLPHLCVLDVHMKTDGGFYKQSLSDFARARFFLIIISRLALDVCYFLVFLFSNNNKKNGL